MQALGVRIDGIGFYVKNLSDVRQKEHKAQLLLNDKEHKMQMAAMEALTEQKEALTQQQALQLTALQQWHAEELRALQATENERRARFRVDLATTSVSFCMPQTCAYIVGCCQGSQLLGISLHLYLNLDSKCTMTCSSTIFAIAAAAAPGSFCT